jgi:hypothetical protein
MEWWHWVLVLSLFSNAVLLVLGYLVVSGLAQLIQRQKSITESQQTLSNQMADIEEQITEVKGDVRKVLQNFVNFAKGLKTGGKSWYDGV